MKKEHKKFSLSFCFRVCKNIFFFLGFLCFIPSIPIVTTLLFNEGSLYIYADQLKKVQPFLPENTILIGKNAYIDVMGNGEMCGFHAINVFYFKDSIRNPDKLKNKLEDLDFNPAKKSDDQSKAELYVYLTNYVLIVEISDGPYDAWFDFRCW